MPTVPALFAQGDDWIFPAVIGAIAIVAAGQALTKSSPKMSARRDGIRRWVISLSVAAGLALFFTGLPGVGFDPRDGLIDRITVALVGGGSAMILFSLLVPLGLFAVHHVLWPPIELVAGLGRALSRWRGRRRDASRMRRERREYDRQAPARHRAETRAIDDARQREDAHASALLSYSFYAAKLGDRFTRAMFDEYVRKYMGGDQTPEVVERRGAELIAIFERHLHDVQPPRKATSMESLARWYEQTRCQIEGLGLEEGVKEVRLIELEQRFNDLLGRHLEETEP